MTPSGSYQKSDEKRRFSNTKGRGMTTEISTQRATGLALQTFDDAMRFGKMVADSEFAPKDFRGKPASCVLAIQAGAEIGLSPMQALQSIAVVNGRPSVFGDAALAVCKASPVCEFVWEQVTGEGDGMVAMCQAKRKGYEKATTVHFCVADAKKAGLWGKAGPWSQYPKRMLQMRARGFALRDAFPDVLRGLVTAEEAQDYPTPEPAREPVVVRPRGTKSQTVAPGVEVHHVESFEPHTPDITTEPASVVTLKTKRQPPEITDPVAKARLAVSRAKTLEDCDTLRNLIATRHTEGVFTDADVAELVKLLHGKAELLIGSEEVATHG
jgi:hypothetical protein